MRPPISLFLSLSLFLFLSLLFPYFPSATTTIVATTQPDIIVQTCKRCSKSSPNVNYTLCVESLRSVPKSHQLDLRGLGIIAVKLAITNAIHIRSKVKELLKAEPPQNRYVKSCLKTCLELYEDAISRLKDSAEALKSGHYSDVNIWISSVVDAPGDCEDNFSEGEVKSPMVAEDDKFFHLAVISLAITVLLG